MEKIKIKKRKSPVKVHDRLFRNMPKQKAISKTQETYASDHKVSEHSSYEYDDDWVDSNPPSEKHIDVKKKEKLLEERENSKSIKQVIEYLRVPLDIDTPKDFFDKNICKKSPEFSDYKPFKNKSEYRYRTLAVQTMPTKSNEAQTEETNDDRSMSLVVRGQWDSEVPVKRRIKNQSLKNDHGLKMH